MDSLSSNRQVLYVEDQDINVQLMRAALRTRCDVDIVVATNVHGALALAPTLQPSLLLLDLRLPDGHGTELLHALRDMPNCRDVPAIAVTSELGFDAKAAGFDDLWPKPMSLREVSARFDRLVPQALPPATASRLTAAHL
jgi:CheY-like chemotaxis protein